MASGALQLTSYSQKECLELAGRCETLRDAFDEHVKDIKDTNLSAPLKEVLGYVDKATA